MKAKIILIFVFVIYITMTFGQRPAMELSFTAINNASWVQMDSIKIMNRTQGGDTVLVYPDTVLVIDYVGVPEFQDASDALSVICYPNPVTEQAIISVFIPGEDVVRIRITDLQGRLVSNFEKKLSGGTHSFTFTPGTESLYLLNVNWKECNQGIKIINLPNHNGKKCFLIYSGYDKVAKQLKAMQAVRSFDYNPGDQLLYIGYADTLQSGMLDTPETSENYTFQFATNIPCPGTHTVEYEGQVYNTIQIFSQCWLKEDLNVGTMIQGNQNMTDNGILEKYCYDNLEVNCLTYGGLYQWNEMMQYTTQQGAHGICPPEWHLPTDEEWKVLEGDVDSQYGISDPEWDISWEYRGFDAGANLKTTNGWYDNGNGTDRFGFSGLPGGFRAYNGFFGDIVYHSYCWSSTEFNDVFSWYRGLFYSVPGVFRGSDFYGSKEDGFSVRCLRDY